MGHVWMGQLHRRLGFHQEPPQRLLVADQRRDEFLDGHLVVQQRILGQVYGAKATPRQVPIDAVLAALQCVAGFQNLDRKSLAVSSQGGLEPGILCGVFSLDLAHKLVKQILRPAVVNHLVDHVL
jgi:hypothetical protein